MSQVFPVNDIDRYVISTATAGQSAFTIPFPFLSADDIHVEKRSINGVSSVLVRGTHYTLAGAGNTAGGTLTLKPAYLAKTGEIYTISGEAVLTRAQSITRGGKFSSTAVDEDFDRLTIVAQELKRDVLRAVKVDMGSSPPELEVGAAGTVPKWDANGNLVAGPSAAALEAIEAALAVEAGRALVHGTGGSDPYDAGSRKIIGVADGSEPEDAINKGQLDAVVGAIDPEGLLARVETLETLMAQAFVPGDIKLTTRKYATDPAGWLLLTTTRTIGATASGATALADTALAEACFTAVWTDYDNTDCPIYTSAGVATTRGASAAADFAADKRLTLPTPAGRFPRIASSTIVTGTKRDNQNKDHIHGASFAGSPLPPHKHKTPARSSDPEGGGMAGGSGSIPYYVDTDAVSAGTPAGTVTVNSSGGTEARPDDFAFTGLIKL